jgi:hypothetical protein
MHRANAPGFPLLSHFEQVRGEMALESRETNLEEGKKIAKDVKEACLEALSSLNKQFIEFDGSNISDDLGNIEIEMNQQSSIKNKEATEAPIQEMS